METAVQAVPVTMTLQSGQMAATVVTAETAPMRLVETIWQRLLSTPEVTRPSWVVPAETAVPVAHRKAGVREVTRVNVEQMELPGVISFTNNYE